MPPLSTKSASQIQLHHGNLEDFYFPTEPWRFLPEPAALTPTPDSFIWACSPAKKSSKSDKPWAWHPKGGSVKGQTHTKVSALLITVESELEAFSLFVKTSFSGRTPLDIEWVNALAVLKKHFSYDLTQKGLPKYWDQILQEAGLEPQSKSLQAAMKLSDLNEAECRLCFQKKWDPSVLELCLSLPDDLRKALLEAVIRFGLSAPHTRDVLNWTQMLSKKFSPKAALELISQKKLQSGDELRVSLFKVAQPELSRLSDLRIEKLRRLYMPPRTAVFGDPSFENDTLKITHTPRSVSDWEAFKEWVEREEVAGKIKDLLDLYQ